MPQPFRLAVQKKLTEAFETIGAAVGYDTEMAGRVYRGRSIFGEETQTPFISILEDAIPEDVEHDSSARSGATTYALMVQGFVDDDSDHPTDAAHVLMAHVKTVLSEANDGRDSAEGIFQLGRKAPMIDRIEFGSGTVRPPDGQISASAYFWLTVTMTLVEDHRAQFV